MSHEDELREMERRNLLLWNRQDPNSSPGVVLGDFQFTCLGEAASQAAHNLVVLVRPFCNEPGHMGAVIDHSGYRWHFDSKAMLDKVEDL